MKAKLELMIFQSGQLDETLEMEQEFENEQEMAEVLVRFAAEQCSVRCDREVFPLYTSGKRIHPPPAQQGYGPETTVVIKKITIL